MAHLRYCDGLGMILLTVTYFGSLFLAGLAWDRSSSKLAAFLSGLIAALLLVTVGSWLIAGFSWAGWDTDMRQNLFWGMAIGILNGWFAGYYLGKQDKD